MFDESEEWVLDELALLVRARGAAPLTGAPLLEPSPRFFPDRWTPDVDGAETIAARLLDYAGLGDLTPEIHLHDEHRSSLDRTAFDLGLSNGFQDQHHGVAGVFYGTQDGRCLLGVRQDLLADPEGIVGTLSHEVAHVYRARHGLVETPDDEEQRTDLTTIFLGFGILTTNGSFRYRQSGWSQGYSVVTVREAKWGGYLPPPQMSFALAVCARARGAGFWERRRIAGHLETSQADWFRSACRKLKRIDLSDRLGLHRAGPPLALASQEEAGELPRSKAS